jgi:anti-sigma-K factor RskA
MDVHELTPAYALDALAAAEAEAFEAHLARCERCRDELADLRETVAALAFGAEAPPPPARLRASILDAVASEQSNVLPFPRRPWTLRLTAVAAAAAACAAVGLGVWGATRGGHIEALHAVVVIGADRHATLTVSGLGRAPHGKTYEAWIIPRGQAARPAGLFAGGGTVVVHLRGPVPSGAVVAATVEHAGGARTPTTSPVLSTQT